MPLHRFAATLTAATFDPPPRLVEAIMRWVTTQFADKIKVDILQKLPKVRAELAAGGLVDWNKDRLEQLLADYTILQTEIDRIHKEIGWGLGPDSKAFNVDLTGWKYLPMLQKRLGVDPQLALQKTPYAQIQVKLDRDKYRIDGYWYPSKSIMGLDCPMTTSNIETLRYELSEIRQLITHEATHAGQDIMRALLSLPTYAGLPSPRLQEPGYSPDGVPLTGPYTPQTREPHPLREVEFKTRLRDEITKFMRESKRIPRNKLHEAIRVWVSILPDGVTYNPAPGKPVFPLTIYHNEFFTELKKHNPAKWRQAVSEFYDGLRREGLPI